MNDLLRQIVAEFKGSWRYRWTAMTVCWITCLFGWVSVYGLPDSYESEATVYVDTNSALKPLLAKMTVRSDVLGRVELVTAAMLGRPQLEKVARETGMHLRADDREEMDAMIFEMEQRISIVNDARREPNLFEIMYRDKDPQMAQTVVASLLKIFVEDSLGASREGTEKAQQFLRDQLASLEADLTESEVRLAEFKKQNVGRMPGEQGGYFTRLQKEMDQLDTTRTELRLAVKRRDTLKRQLTGEQPTMVSSASGPQSELDQRIVQNQNRLEELQLRFTDLHPDVISVKATLEQLRELQKQQLDALLNEDSTVVASDNPVFQNIQIDLANVNVQIATLTETESNQQRKIKELRSLIDVLPGVEAELSRLTRNYDVKQAQYRSLLQRLEVAVLSESAEQSEEVKFRVIDPPFLPDKPAAPNRPLFLAIVLLLGLGAGGGLAFLRNQLQPVFNDPITLREVTGLPVLGSISLMQSREGYRKHSYQLATFSSALLALGLVFVVFLLLHDPGSKLMQSLT